MSSVADALKQAADVFDKTAEYLETTESVRISAEKQEKTARAKKLANQLSELTGEELDVNVIEKLSGIDPDVQDLLGRLGGGDMVDSLGGPSESEKRASVDGVPPEDAQFLTWVNS